MTDRLEPSNDQHHLGGSTSINKRRLVSAQIGGAPKRPKMGATTTTTTATTNLPTRANKQLDAATSRSHLSVVSSMTRLESNKATEPPHRALAIRHWRPTTGHLQLARRRRLGVMGQIITLVVLNHIISSHLNDENNNIINSSPRIAADWSLSSRLRNVLPRVQSVGALECDSDSDCPMEKSCYDNKCTCSKVQPVEDGDRCYPHALYGETCQLNEQCLGSSTCDRGYCTCAFNQVAVFNPSTRIWYCHDKRALNEPCGHDSQCPSSAYCSTKSGCLCQNGFGPARVNTGQGETLQCLAKTCRTSGQCESEFHTCEEDKCKCLATHFDPETARCYKFAASKAASDDLTNTTSGDNSRQAETGGGLGAFFKDLIETRDNNNRWLLVILLALLSLVVFGLVVLLIRQLQLGHCCCCWTVHKMAEYEPNGTNAAAGKAAGNGFDKNSISQKSFRRKSNVDVEEGQSALSTSSEEPDDNSLLVADNSRIGSPGNGPSTNRSSYATPLKTSTSTPV